MKIATLERANKIVEEIEKLKKEVNWLNCKCANGWMQRVLFGIKTACIRNRSKFSWDEYFDLESEDIEILQNRRILKVRQLYEELGNLTDTDYEEKGGAE